MSTSTHHNRTVTIGAQITDALYKLALENVEADA